MDPSFTFAVQDILCISVSLNALYFLQLLTSRLVHWLLPLLAPRGSRWKTLYGLHRRWPDLLGRLLMEQLSLFVLLVLVLVNLGFVSSVVPPFSHHHDDDEVNDYHDDDENDNKNSNNKYHQLTRVILSASTARFILVAVGIALNNDRELIPIRITSTNTRNAHIDLVYCVFGIASNVIGLGYKQNLLILVTSSFMELNTTSLVICRLIKLADRHRCCRSYLKTSVLCCAAFLFSSVLLPVLFLCHALAQESPFVMGKVPLVWFFVSAGFYLVFHSMFMYYSVRRIIKASSYLSEEGTHSCSVHEPFSVCNYSERLMNDIYNDCEDIMDFDIAKEGGSTDSEELSFKCNPTTKLRDLNYGFLAPYDNRNLCSFVSGVEEEKINFLQTKNISKNELMYKFLMKGNKNGKGECCCKLCSHSACGSKDDLYLNMDTTSVEQTEENLTT